MEVDLEKEALTIAAHTMKREADELRNEVARLSEALAAVEAQRDGMERRLKVLPDASLWARLKEAEGRADEYLDFLRSTKQLVAFEYWIKRRRVLLANEAELKKMTA